MIERKTGTVIYIGSTEQIGESFTKRVIVIDQSEVSQDGREFENFLPVEFVGNRIGMLDSIVVGQQVTISFSLVGRERQGKWFVSARGLNVVPYTAIAQQQIQNPQHQQAIQNSQPQQIVQAPAPSAHPQQTQQFQQPFAPSRPPQYQQPYQQPQQYIPTTTNDPFA